jgi:hypothetical protein
MRPSRCAFSISPRKPPAVFLISTKNFGTGLSISCDGRWLLYSQIEEQNNDIMIIELFS